MDERVRSDSIATWAGKVPAEQRRQHDEKPTEFFYIANNIL
jgi:hypothetical protein